MKCNKMKSELKLEHLAPYLPYGLLLSVIKDYSIGEGFWILKGNETDLESPYLNVQLTHCKPILRPLSDLTKEIEHNGEKFFIKDLGPLYSREFSEFWYLVNKQRNVMACEYWFVQKLFEWHFDVFGLIDKGLAIDINTLNNQK